MRELSSFKLIDQTAIIIAASIAHEVNRAFCASIGDLSQPSWEHAPQWQKNSAIAGVLNYIEQIDLKGFIKPHESHESWLRQKIEEGWKYGPVKNVELLEHPCFMPYDDLPAEQKAKDKLFIATVEAYLAQHYY